jgi:hypothetical protein
MPWTWTTKIVEDDGQRVEIERLGPYRWRLRNLTAVIAPEDRHPDEIEVTGRREAIRLASERWAVHPRLWEDEP